MILETFTVGAFACNCSIIGCEDTGEALIIDPGDDADGILKRLEQLRLRPAYLLHTHAHFDHVGATQRVAVRTGALVALHRDDQPLYDHLPDQTAWFGLPPVDAAPVDHWLADEERLTAGAVTVGVLHTPGHTPGSVSFTSRSAAGDLTVFAGDTLFRGGVGRTDLWGGSAEGLLASIRERLLTLPDDTPVVPGHGPATTIGRERRLNPFLIVD